MPRYKKIKVNIKQETLEKLIDSYLSDYGPSRGSVAEDCSVSVVTSGKVANALIESGFMTQRVFTKQGESSCAHLFCREDTSILIADISSSIFKMTVMNSSGEIKFSSNYSYDSSVSRADNLNIFFSRYGTMAANSKSGFCAIAVIYPNENALSHLEGQGLIASLPTISSKEYVSDTVFAIFGKRPAAHFTVSQAICEAIKFKLHGDLLLEKGVSYIFVGSHLSLFHIHSPESVTVCAPNNILADSDMHLLGNHFIEKNDSDRIFIRLADFMGAAFSPISILLESDLIKPDDETVRKITKRFALSRLKLPMIYYKSNSYPLCLMGAVRSTLCTIIKRYVIP